MGPQLGRGGSLDRPLLRGAKAEQDVLDVGGDDEDVRADGGRQQCRGEVLVDDGLDAAQRAVGVAHHRDAATAGTDDDVSGVGEQLDGRVLALQHLVDVLGVDAVFLGLEHGVSSTSSGSGEATTRRQPRAPRSSQVWPCSTSVAAWSAGR